jgi:hypothetical protein
MAEADLTAGEIVHMRTASELYLHDTAMIMTYTPATDAFGNPGPPTYVKSTVYPCRFAPAMQREVLADTDVPILDGSIWFSQEARSDLAGEHNRIRITHRWGTALEEIEVYEIEGAVKQEFALVHVDVRKATTAFLPSSVVGLQLWLKSDAGLYQDTAKTTLATLDGDSVGAWEDQSGQGNDATQATSSKQPALKLNKLNKKPIIRFDGSDDTLLSGTFTAIQPQVIFIVFKQVSWTSGRYVFDGQAVIKCGAIQFGSSGLIRQITGPLAAPGVNFGTSVFNIGVFRFADAGGYIRRNGAQTNQTGGTGEDVTALRLAARGDDSLYSETDMAEVVVYDDSPSLSDIQQVEIYLADKYKITLA